MAPRREKLGGTKEEEEPDIAEEKLGGFSEEEEPCDSDEEEQVGT